MKLISPYFEILALINLLVKSLEYSDLTENKVITKVKPCTSMYVSSLCRCCCGIRCVICCSLGDLPGLPTNKSNSSGIAKVFRTRKERNKKQPVKR